MKWPSHENQFFWMVTHSMLMSLLAFAVPAILFFCLKPFIGPWALASLVLFPVVLELGHLHWERHYLYKKYPFPPELR